jgi:hypothetical protein
MHVPYLDSISLSLSERGIWNELIELSKALGKRKICIMNGGIAKYENVVLLSFQRLLQQNDLTHLSRIQVIWQNMHWLDWMTY